MIEIGKTKKLQRNEERRRSNGSSRSSWAEICCLGCTCLQLLWPRVVLRKWLNISSKDSDFSADTDVDDIDDDEDDRNDDDDEDSNNNNNKDRNFTGDLEPEGTMNFIQGFGNVFNAYMYLSFVKVDLYYNFLLSVL